MKKLSNSLISVVVIFCLISVDLYAQIEESKNGYYLPTSGTIRALIIFIEVNYDIGTDPYSASGAPGWAAGELPVWKDQLLDPYITQNPQGALTRFFKESSFGSYNVLGDYLINPNEPDKPLIINASEATNSYTIRNAIVNAVNQYSYFKTANNFTVSDFDNWTLTSNGLPKITPSVDMPHKYDYIFYITRNANIYGDYSGSTSTGSFGQLFGYHGDAYTLLNASNDLPFNISKHEYAHGLLGNNGFHIDGGAVHYGNYFIPLNYTWGIMTGANASLQSCNAFDRDRLNWIGPDKTMTISARNAENTDEVNGDLDASNPAHAGVYTLRDFVTTGDAIRIKLPFLPSGEFQQWIWIENHRTIHNNGSFYDKFIYQGNDCVDDASPGLYMYLQVDKNDKQGNNTFGGYTNYLQTKPASGCWDFFFETTLQQNNCISSNFFYPFYKLTSYNNPLSGNHDQQRIPVDANGDNQIFNNEGLELIIEKAAGHFIKRLSNQGTAEMAFTLLGKNKIGMGTNPSTASVMSLVHTNWLYTIPPNNKQNNRKIILSGVSVEILNEDINGNITVQVRFDDVDVNNDIRWCGDEIVLSPVATLSGISLNLKTGNTLTLDQSLSATRINNPQIINGQKVFASPTLFRCTANSWFNMENSSNVIVDKNSILKLESNSKYVIENNSNLVIKAGCTLYVDECATLQINGTGKLTIENGGSVCISDGAILDFENGQQNLNLITGYIVPTGYIDPVDYVPPYNTITSNNEVWTNKTYFVRNLSISQNAKLTLQDSKLIFTNESSKLVINPSGTFISDNSTLTSNGCNNSMWRGIELHGNSAASQLPTGGVYQQGIVEIINGGTIENAVCGIRTINSEAPNPSATTGGIIRANNAVFRNCQKAIEFMPYQNRHPVNNNLKLANSGLISQCTFETDDNLYTRNMEPIAFISLAGVQGVKIYGNTFTNTITQNFYSRGIGILSAYSSFYLLPVCTSQTYPCPEMDYQKNTFNGLQYGIWAGSASSQFNIQIENCIFSNNFGSISLNGITNATVVYNAIDVGSRSFSGDAPWDMSFGLMLNQCTGYTVEENNFTTTDNGSYGVIVKKSGYSPNIIYKNTFDGSIVPFHAEGKNGFSSAILRNGSGNISLPAFSGLVFKCNDFQVTNTLWDIEITSGSISPFQGSCYNEQTPAGNQFNHPVDPYLGRIAVNYYVSPFTYFHHSDPVMTPYISSFFNSYHVITKQLCGAMSANSCLSNFSNCDPVCLINNINLYANVLSPLNTQIFKGNNQNLLNRVITANTVGGISFAALRDTLLNVSPYLSDTILIAAIEKYDTLEPVMLKDVMVANSPLTYKVKTVLDTKALSDRIREAIDSVQSGTSARAELEAKISDTSMLMGLAENELIRQYMNDTTITGIDSVISYFLTKTDDISRKNLVQAYYAKGDSANLLPALDSLWLQTHEDTLFKEFYTMMAGFCTDKNLLYEIDSIQELAIRNIASSKTEAAAHAQTVLAMVYNETPSVKLEKVNIPDRFSIHGYLKSDSLCNGLPAAGDTILLLGADTGRITFITPVITDSTGYFVFYLPELLQLSDTAEYGFGTTYAAPVKNFELKTIEQWIAASPLNLTLRKTEADFIYDTIRCYAGSVHFTSIVTDGKKPYTYSWDFGNDSVSTSPNPAMLFDTTGAYHVTLVVSSTDGCTDTVDKTVIVNPLPEITITTSDSTICKGDSAILTGSGGATYLWSTSDTSAVITIAPDLTTTYTVTVTSAEGCTNTASFTITVNSLPTAAINSSDSTICAGDSVTLTASGGVTYLWNTADTTAAIIVVPNTTTTYTVTVTSTEECIDSANKTVTVNILPTAAITPASSSICTGDSVTLTASGGVTYLWNTADTATVITVVPDSTTTYKVTVLSAEGCEDSDTATITIDCASITGRTMYAGKANVNTAPNPPTYNSRTYDINKEIVILKNQSGTEIARDTSDANGAFSFTNVDNGTYTLFYDKYTADTMQWCNNVNAVDIALIKYLIASDTTTDPSRNFSRIYKKSADVDNNGTVDSIDRARIQAKVAFPSDPTKNFPKGNWVNLDTTVIVNGANLNVTIPVISYGDYNASSSKYKDSANTWSQVKSLTDENIITISDESLILNNTGIIAIPLQISSSLDDFAAMSLELFYPKEKFKLVSASMPNTSDSNGVFKINPTLQEIIDNNNDLLVTDDSGIIRVVFATTNFFDVTNNDIMIYLGFRPLYELKSGELNFKLFGTGIITDQYGKEAKDMDYLLMPKIFVQGNHTEAGFDFTGYPNPFNNSTTLTYNLPKNGTVKLRVYNVFGVCVSELVNEEQMSGKHSVVFSAKNQPAGMYSFRLDFTGENDSNCVVLKMIYYK